MKTYPLTNHEEYCLNNAVYFTAVRGLVSNRIVQQFHTIDEARVYGQSFGDNRTMIYAITQEGYQAHIENA